VPREFGGADLSPHERCAVQEEILRTNRHPPATSGRRYPACQTGATGRNGERYVRSRSPSTDFRTHRRATRKRWRRKAASSALHHGREG
jgi:hypothetical protein